MVKMTVKRLLCLAFALMLAACCAFPLSILAADLPADYVNLAGDAKVTVSNASGKTTGENS